MKTINKKNNIMEIIYKCQIYEELNKQNEKINKQNEKIIKSLKEEIIILNEKIRKLSKN